VQCRANLFRYRDDVIRERGQARVQKSPEALQQAPRQSHPVIRQLRLQQRVYVEHHRHPVQYMSGQRGQQAFGVVRVQDVVAAAADPGDQFRGQQGIQHEELLIAGARRLAVIGAHRGNAVDTERGVLASHTEVVREDVHLVPAAAQLVGHAIDADRRATGRRERARGHHGDSVPPHRE
jgi:hypothetical protein